LQRKKRTRSVRFFLCLLLQGTEKSQHAVYGEQDTHNHHHHAKAVANVLLLELELGYRGKGINFLDKLEEGEVQDHEQSEAAGY